MNLDIINEFNNKINNLVKYFKEYINKININNISIELLNNINVNYLNKNIPIYKLALINKENLNTFILIPFDLKLIKLINNSILNENLDLNTFLNKDNIKITYSQMTNEKKIKIIKIIKLNLEKTKISIRNIKKEFNNKIKLIKIKNKISEDYIYENNKKITDLINNSIKNIDKLMKSKENLILK